jgi:hypothetical protein
LSNFFIVTNDEILYPAEFQYARFYVYQSLTPFQGFMFIYVVNRALPYSTAVSPSDFLSIDTSFFFLAALAERLLNDTFCKTHISNAKRHSYFGSACGLL